MSTYSLLRIVEYRELSKLTLDGRILDLGGSRKSGYHGVIGGRHEFVVVNISEEHGYDLKFDIEKAFPLADGSFDHVFFINVLEHIYGHRNVVSETLRVLKPGGTATCVVPFMFNVHGSPDDYFRYTRSALSRIFADAGFKPENVVIREIGCGVLHVAYQMVCGLIPTRVLKDAARWTAVRLDELLGRASNSYRARGLECPLGYMVVATKR